MISVKHLTYQLGGRAILDGLNLEFPSAAHTVIAGPNGCGKSTLIRSMAGSALPGEVQGTVVLGSGASAGSLADSPQAKARQLSVLTQREQAVPMTVYNLVKIGRFPYCGFKPTERDLQIVLNVLEEMDLVDFMERPVNQLSGGEQRRAHIARVLAQAENGTSIPSVILLDEPMDSLDPRFQDLVIQAINKRVKEGYAVVTVLHDLNMINRVADRVVLMKNGSVVAVGLKSEVLTANNLSTAFDIPFRVVASSDNTENWIVSAAGTFSEGATSATPKSTLPNSILQKSDQKEQTRFHGTPT